MNKTKRGCRKRQDTPVARGAVFSFYDFAILFSAFVLTILGWKIVGAYSLFLVFVIGHFFLFCNVFRVRRKTELLWAIIFIINYLVCTILDYIDILWIFSIQLVVTLILILIEVRHPHYSGVFSTRIKPGIDDWIKDKGRPDAEWPPVRASAMGKDELKSGINLIFKLNKLIF